MVLTAAPLLAGWPFFTYSGTRHHFSAANSSAKSDAVTHGCTVVAQDIAPALCIIHFSKLSLLHVRYVQ